MSKIYWISLYGALLAAILTAGVSDLMAHEHHVDLLANTFDAGGILLNAMFGAAIIPLGVTIGLFVTHGLILRYCCFLNTRWSRRLGLLLCFALPLVFVGNYGYGEIDNLLPLIFLQSAVVWLVVFSRFSIPSGWVGLFPLFLCYLLIFFQMVVRVIISGTDSPWDWCSWNFLDVAMSIAGFSILYFGCLPMAGYLFPKHRNLKEYWKPAKLPRLKHCPWEGARP